MTLTIKNNRVEWLVRETAAIAEESLTDAIGHAMEERLQRLKGRKTAASKLEGIMQISERCAHLPDRDTRSPDEILGYGEEGAPDGH